METPSEDDSASSIADDTRRLSISISEPDDDLYRVRVSKSAMDKEMETIAVEVAQEAVRTHAIERDMANFIKTVPFTA